MKESRIHKTKLGDIKISNEELKMYKWKCNRRSKEKIDEIILEEDSNEVTDKARIAEEKSHEIIEETTDQSLLDSSLLDKNQNDSFDLIPESSQ